MEASKEIVYRKSARAKRKLRFLAAALFLVPLGAIVFLGVNLRPVMAAQAEARIQSVCSTAMNMAILDVMQEDGGYADLVNVKEDGKHVYLLQANARGMNVLASTCAEAAQKEINHLGRQGISIQLGTITGIPFFSGKGPYIHISFTPVGSVQSSFHSEFVSAGINQTLYRVNLDLQASVRLLMPGVTQTVKVNAGAAICENILVGEVPQVYTNVADEEDMLNLIPTDIP